MRLYIQQLTADLEAAILSRWQEHPPHYFEMGLTNEPGLTPPVGYTGPPAGFGYDDPTPLPDWMLGISDVGGKEEDEAEDDFDPNTEKALAEMEQWRDEDAPEHQDMFYHFGFKPEQFPPAEQLTDADLDTLSALLCRLWAAYNFTAVIPDEVPGRLVYPLLLERMSKPTYVMTRGNIGVEFCGYEPEHCPFGTEWCSCKDYDI